MAATKLFFGVYRAIVISAEDAQQRGRVQVKIPVVTGDQQAWRRRSGKAMQAFSRQNQKTKCWSRSKAATSHDQSS